MTGGRALNALSSPSIGPSLSESETDQMPRGARQSARGFVVYEANSELRQMPALQVGRGAIPIRPRWCWPPANV
jgi:hypothetical protein